MHPVAALFRPAFLASVATHGAVVVVAALVAVKAPEPEPERRGAAPAWIAFAPSPAESSSGPSEPWEESPVLPEVLVEAPEALPAVAEPEPEAPWEAFQDPIPEPLLPATPAPHAPMADARVAPRRAPAPAAAANAPGVARDAGSPGERAAVLAPPRPLASNRAPVYPYAARAHGLQGVVYLRVAIDSDGSVASALIESSSGHSVLDRAAEDAVRGWRFTPAHVDGVPSATTVRIPVTFRLS